MIHDVLHCTVKAMRTYSLHCDVAVLHCAYTAVHHYYSAYSCSLSCILYDAISLLLLLLLCCVLTMC
jgi:hypothetical protein